MKFSDFGMCIVALAILSFASSGSAVELPVSYVADFKTFKKEAVAGNSLSFDLFAAADCTGTVFHAELKFLASGDLQVEKVIPQKAKGEKPSPPRGVRLRTTLGPPVVVEQLYLKVSGDGVVPIGGECQVQTAAIPGPSGPEGAKGPPGASGLTLRVFDGSDVNLGLLIREDLIFSPLTTVTAYREDLDAFVLIDKSNGLLIGPTGVGAIVFELPNCVGTAYLPFEFATRLVFTGPVTAPDRFFVGGNELVSSAPFESIIDLLSPPGCMNTVGVRPEAVTAREVLSTVVGMPVPLALPIHSRAE